MLNPASTTLQLLGRYSLTLARYDQDYDVRDRARLVASLLAGVVPNILGDREGDEGDHGGVILRREQVKMVLFEHKAAVKEPSALEGTYPPGVFHHCVHIYRNEWLLFGNVKPSHRQSHGHGSGSPRMA